MALLLVLCVVDLVVACAVGCCCFGRYLVGLVGCVIGLLGCTLCATAFVVISGFGCLHC